jgi:hypothetical protein
MRRIEDRIQRAVCQHLQRRGAKGLVWFAVPNGGWRRPAEAAIMKATGIRPGVSDLIVLHNGVFHALELKSESGRATDAQRQFLADVITAGGKGAIAAGIDAALEQLESWGLLRGTSWTRSPIAELSTAVMTGIAQ